MSKDFKTYERKKQIIKPEDNVFFMYYQVGSSWIFKGVVSKSAKEYIQSDGYINDLNKKFKDEVILASFSGKEIESSKKVYLFVPCPNAEVVTYFPTFEK